MAVDVKAEPEIRVLEILHTISGEGPTCGRPTVAVRTGGSMLMTPTEILAQVRNLSGPCLITLAGANPPLHDLSSLIQRGQDMLYTFSCEVDGSMQADWFAVLNHLTISPKPPSSGDVNDFRKINDCFSAAYTGDTYTDVAFSVTVRNHSDYLFAREIHENYASAPMWLIAGTDPAVHAQGPEHTSGPEDMSDFWEPSAGTRADLVISRFMQISERVLADKWSDVHVGIPLDMFASKNRPSSGPAGNP